MFFFLSLMGGQKEGSAGTAVVFPTSSQQGGGWKMRFSGERKWRAFGFKFVCFSSGTMFFLFYFFMSLQTKPANQTCPDMASPGFYRWFPVSRGGATHSHHSLTHLFYSKETSSNPHHFLCASSVSLFRKVPDGLFKCLRYLYGNQYPPSILAWVCRDWRQLESVRGAASSFSYYQRLAG